VVVASLVTARRAAPNMAVTDHLRCTLVGSQRTCSKFDDDVGIRLLSPRQGFGLLRLDEAAGHLDELGESDESLLLDL
jgi:hypothetical protein